MKIAKFLPIAAFAACLAIFVACNTPQQTIAYKTLYSVEKATTGAYDGYISLVIAGRIKTNGLDKVSAKFNQFQAAAMVAEGLVEHNTNALAPGSLIIESQDIINLITTLKGAK